MADFARAERLRKLRDDRHLSQEDAAHEIGVSVRSLRAWEKGGGIRWPNAKAVAAFYGVNPETLVSRDRDEDDPTPDVMGALSPEPAVAERLEKIEKAILLLRKDLGRLALDVRARTSPARQRPSPKSAGDK